jgi:tRNA-dihydrouridine synthase
MIGRAAINNPQIFNFLKGNKIISSEKIKKEYNELAEEYNAPFRYRKNIMKRMLFQ